ncbi:MAG: 4Fe-4S dicluster domain-containing protein [Planctomycetota bacterium]
MPTEIANAPPANSAVKEPAALQQAAAQPAVSAAAGSAKPAPRRKRKFGIAIYHAWCKKCGICGEFCPTKALRNDELGMPLVSDEDKCVGCMQCMHRCPDFCVEVYEKTAPEAPSVAPQKQAEPSQSSAQPWG